jgi:hypothetical protein
MNQSGTPPCVSRGSALNACARAVQEWTVRAVGALHGPWQGWRLAGRWLVTPDGVRLSPERVRGLAWRQDAEARRDAAKARNATQDQLVRVVVVRLSDVRDGVRAA